MLTPPIESLESILVEQKKKQWTSWAIKGWICEQPRQEKDNQVQPLQTFWCVCFSEYVNKRLCLRRICSPKIALKLIKRLSNALSSRDTYLDRSDRRADSLLFAIENDATSCASPSASEHLRNASLELIKWPTITYLDPNYNAMLYQRMPVLIGAAVVDFEGEWMRIHRGSCSMICHFLR